MHRAEEPSEKARLRREMRSLRRSLPDQRARSAQIVARLLELPQVVSAQHVLVFDAVPGEPDLSALVAELAGRDVETRVPEDDVDASWPDVVVVPGVAFTPSGDRLGQGGGWYDRFLPQLRADCPTIGVAFAQQVVSSLPAEPHDVRVDLVVTDA